MKVRYYGKISIATFRTMHRVNLRGIDQYDVDATAMRHTVKLTDYDAGFLIREGQTTARVIDVSSEIEGIYTFFNFRLLESPHTFTLADIVKPK